MSLKIKDRLGTRRRRPRHHRLERSAPRTRGLRLLGRKLFRAISNEAATEKLLAAVERAPTLVRRAAIAFTDGNRWTISPRGCRRRQRRGGLTAARRRRLARPAHGGGAGVVKIACDARQTEVVGVLRRHAAGVNGLRRKPRPPPPPEEQVPEPTPTSEAPPPPAETAPTEAPPNPAAPPAPEPLFTVGTRVEARFEGETSGTPAW